MARKAGWCVLSVGLFAAITNANVIITLDARNEAGDPLASPVSAGALARIDIYLSADGVDDPVPNLRLFQFNLSGTSPEISIESFEWQLGLDAYSFQISEPPTVAALTTSTGPSPMLISLTSSPLLVATVHITIDASGVLDVRNTNSTDINSIAMIVAGFGLSPDDPRVDYSLIAGNLTGGVIEFTVGDTGDDGGPDLPPTDGGDTGIPQPDNDWDNDGYFNPNDAFPYNPFENTDTNGNGLGDNADPDDDGDGVPDTDDAFPTDPAESVDTNGDGVGDNADPDDDSDSVPDESDAFPGDPDEVVDSDGDGVGDATDAFPADPTETTDSNGNGIGDNAEDEARPNPPAPSPRVCGMGMLAPSLLVLAALQWTSLRVRRGPDGSHPVRSRFRLRSSNRAPRASAGSSYGS